MNLFENAKLVKQNGKYAVKLDEEANHSHAAVISAPDSKACVRVIPKDEELGIARRTYELI